MITKFVINGKSYWIPEGWDVIEVEGAIYERRHSPTGPYWCAR